MITWKDQFGILRGMDVSCSSCGKWVNLALYVPDKRMSGDIVQMPKAAFEEFKMQLYNLKEKE